MHFIICFILFVIIFYMIYNPIFELDDYYRFGIVAACSLILTLLTIRVTTAISYYPIISIIIFYILLIRLNCLDDECSNGIFYVQVIPMVFLFSFSIYFFGRYYSSLLLCQILGVIFLTISIILVYNIWPLDTFFHNDKIKLGSLSQGSYQKIATCIGFASLFIINLLIRKNLLYKILSIFLSVYIVYIMFDFRARGESIALFLAIIYMFSRLLLIILIASIPFLLNIIIYIGDEFDLFVINNIVKLMKAGGDVGRRIELINIYYQNMLDNIHFLLIGGGSDIFQYINRFSMGLYVHNYLLESLIVGGVVMFSYYLYYTIRPFIFKRHVDYIYQESVLIFLLLTSLKSGTIMSNLLLYMAMAISAVTIFERKRQFTKLGC